MFNDAFLKACYGKPTERIPVWFMRQAGRSLPGYRELRKKYDLLTLIRSPELAAQVSLEPIERLNVDAAIVFADIMLLPIALGVDVEIIDGVGPVVGDPITSVADSKRLQPFNPDSVDFLRETIRILRGELQVPLIGFSAAPFTIASYLLEGEPTRRWVKTKRFMFTQPDGWSQLMEVLSDAIVAYLSMQIDAGAQAVQLFDSWVGCLSPEDYRVFVLPYVQKIFAALKDKGVPRIHFGTNTAGMLTDFANVDCEVIGLDWHIDLNRASSMVGGKALQGNLDPMVVLTADRQTIRLKADSIIDSLPTRDGFIFNFGHGVLPETEVTKLQELVEYIHDK